jgi:predicted nucleic acid-binding protein
LPRYSLICLLKGIAYLLPQDALILAEAERLGITAVATLDRDWRRVTEFDVYTTPV